MMTVNEMKELKQQMGYSCRQISELSGVPVGTVQKIFSGVTKSPRHETLASLEKIFREADGFQSEPSDGNNYTYSFDPINSAHVSEEAVAYTTYDDVKFPRQGEYTLDDYLALPDDQRYELIDGYLFEMNVPYPVHQDITFMLGHYFQNFIESNNGECRVLPSPVDVQLDMDDKTIVEPDLCICCDMDKVKGPRIYGAPDMLIEVLSKSTRKKDLTIKAGKYSNAGVKEYWTVDPARLKITVFNYMNEGEITIYGFQDKVPVALYDGKLVIDFSKIYDRIKEMYGVGTDL